MIDGDVNASTGRTTAEEPAHRRVQSVAAIDDPLAKRGDDLRHLVKEVGVTPRPRLVHQLRTTIRRFETLLPEPSAASPRAERKVRAQLERIRQRAGKVRDADVHLQALRSLARGIAGEAQAQVRDGLRQRRAKCEKRLVRTLAAEREDGLMKRLHKVTEQGTGGGPKSDADRARILGKVIERFDGALQAATPLSAENLHGFRLQTKRLRYVAETAGPSALATTTVAQLKRVQDAIGAWHDWLTLTERVEKLADGSEVGELLDALRARTAAQLEKALKATTGVGRRLMALRPKAARRGPRSVTAAPPAVLRSTGASA